MPDVRCKWYQTDGTSIHGGCPTPGCRFIHPDQKGWTSLRPYKSSARCKYFDYHGKPINGGCRSSLKGCRFIHPDEPGWDVKEKHRAQPERKSNSPAVSSVSRSTQPDTDQRTVVAKESKIDQLLGALKAVHESAQSRTPALSGSLVVAHKSKDPPAADVGAELKYASRPILLPSLTSSRYSQMDPRRSSVVSESTSSLSKTTDGDVPRQTWKRQISLLAQAHDLIQKLSEINADLERRTLLQSAAIIPVIASSAEANLEALRDSARRKQDSLEEKLNTVITQLIQEDIWPLPSTTQSDFSVERYQLELSASIAELERRLDVMVAHFNEIKEMGNLHRDPVVLYEGEDDSMLRRSKRRRIAANGSFQASFDLQDILARLDNLQSKAIELETESFHDDRLLEVVDERVEGWVLKKPVARPVLPDSLDDIVRNLDVELDVLCAELADLDTSDLVSQIGALRLETGSLKQTMELLASDQQSLQKRQVDLDQQIHKIMEELEELRIMPRDKPKVATNKEEIVAEVTLDVQKYIDTERGRLHNTIKSCHEEIRNTVFAELEPMVIKTETMYNSLHSQTNAS